MNTDLQYALSDILTFSGDTGMSKSGLIRLDQVSDKEFVFAMSLDTHPRDFLAQACCIVFLKILVPSCPEPQLQEMILRACTRFADGFTGSITQIFDRSVIEISCQTEPFFYAVRVKLP